MNGEIAAANQRLTSPASRKNDSARLGAAIAFQQSQASSNVNSKSSAAAAAAIASRMNRNVQTHSDMDSDGPEVGSVRDKIGRFAGNSLAPPSNASVSTTRSRTPSFSKSPIQKSPARSPAPEQVAARLAAERSPGRKPEPALDAARLGAMRSASRMQAQTQLPLQSRPTGDRQEMRSPVPVRPSLPVHDSVNRMLSDNISILDQDPGYTRSPSVRSSARSRAGSIRSQATSPQPSVSSRISLVQLDEVKPKLPPRSTASSQASIRKPIPVPNTLRQKPSLTSISAQSYHSSSSAVDEVNGMDEEALSNAIIASSLASTRASPMPSTSTPPVPPPRRRARARSLLQLSHSPKADLSRTPSPPKGMPMTLRGAPKDDDNDPRKPKRNLLHKHPHKHHEGDRKRWRMEVLEKERKRYEGVWASNKGLFIPPELNRAGEGKWPPPSEMVLNLVVREIWSRSRLPPSVLEQVWNLVDHQDNGLLTKEEFVVGMWLIDQQLKGHKLPPNVPDSVWDSVRYVTGIKLTSIGK